MGRAGGAAAWPHPVCEREACAAPTLILPPLPPRPAAQYDSMLSGSSYSESAEPWLGEPRPQVDMPEQDGGVWAIALPIVHPVAW
jgi:hypothetical protein